MMRFNVAQLLKAPVGVVREYVIDDEIEIDDVTVASRLVGSVKFTRISNGILVAAALDLTVILTCSRCLEELTYPLHLKFDEEFLPTVDIVTGLELPDQEDEGVFTIDANHILDITRAAREYVLLGLPMRPLCSEKCLGLCPKCGKNLNLGKCSCAAAAVDSRMAALAQLLDGEELD